jgi:hypothetical protein
VQDVAKEGSLAGAQITYADLVATPQQLADTLASVSEPEYVRFVAQWMTSATDLDVAPDLTGNPVIDALVAAATAHVAVTRGDRIPDWTEERGRSLSTVWYPGPNALLPNALVHSPLAFTLHGVLVEEASLASI